MTDNYESKILTTVVNKYLDEIISMDRNCLNRLQKNSDEVVWNIVTKIYKESGHKISFESVLDIIKFRIKKLSNNLDHIEKINRLEQERKALEEENKRLEEEGKILEQEREKNKIFNKVLYDFNQNKNQAEIFIKVRKIFCEMFDCSESKVNKNTGAITWALYRRSNNWSSLHGSQRVSYDYDLKEAENYYKGLCMVNDWDGEGLEAVEFVLALEEEFNLEIPDEDSYELLETLEKIVEYIDKKINGY